MREIIARTYKIGDFAKLIGVSVATLQRWDREGRLKAYRSPTGRRYYLREQADSFIGREASDG